MTPESLLRALADGELHSGEALARRFGVTRAAVWKQVGKLADWGLEVEAVPGIGYRLDRRIDLVDIDVLRAALPTAVADVIERIDVFTELDSTNRFALAQPPSPGRMNVCLAEYQSAGRGRRGRRWVVPIGAGICLSMGFKFGDTPRALSAMTLAVGVVVRRVLRRVAGVDVGLKWPNDLVLDERKLGGILLELTAEAQGGCHVVAGVGINVALPPAVLPELCDWPRGAIDLAGARDGDPPSRVALAAALIVALAELFVDYADSGFAAYREEWRRADYLRGRRVSLDAAAGQLVGVARGIEADGALLVETAAGERERIIAGDVSVRGI